MCGRFVLFSSLDDIVREFEIERVQAQLRPSYNVAPTQEVAVVVRDQGVNVLDKMVWGLIPSWARDPGIGSRMINARSETVHEKPSFKGPFKSQRCLIVADGFYEWQKTNGGKVPMFIRLRSRRPFGLAGLYDVWKTLAGEKITSCTIITTNANQLVRPIHNRMPVILSHSDQAVWLDAAPQPTERLLSLLAPYPADEMEAYAVSRMVNSPKNDDPRCIEPVGG
ncbi:MAG: SOS response-associated peptidase [Ardenticatenia bacterium]|nr:SOS response-associated peptidase [Ardenticatenia bacterium]